MKKTAIAMVSYHNTFPFLEGLRASDYVQDYMDLSLMHPAACADLYREEKVDIALLPVGALPHIGEHNIVTDFCIGCDGAVRTVCILANRELSSCTQLYLDHHSRSSAVLAQVLLKQKWGKVVPVATFDASDYTKEEGAAYLFIGDKVYDHEGDFKHSYDLGTLWKETTGLPFTFAVWVARPSVQAELVNQLNIALADGVSRIPQLLEEHYNTDYQMQDYITNRISYPLDKSKKMAMTLFLEKGFDYKVK